MIDLEALETRARKSIPASISEYFAGGADAEQTLRDNVDAWRRLGLVPLVMRDVSVVSTEVDLFGTRVAMPILAGPWAFQGLAHPGGELETAAGAQEAGTIFVSSAISTLPIEATAPAETGGAGWFQFYVLRDRFRLAELLHRALTGGYQALVLTVDKLPIGGKRRRRAADRFTLPEGTAIPNFDYVVPPGHEPGPDEYLNQLLEDSAVFEDISWAVEQTGLPVLVKGILDADDAVTAVDHGAAGIVVSNHGGRQLDGAVSTARALPAIVDAVAGRVPVLVDGGIRSGIDIMKALALGASAVLVVRPIIWGLIDSGAAGVTEVLNELADELRHTMALCGTPTLADIDRRRVISRP